MEEKEVKRRVNKYERETKTLMQRIEREKKKREKDENDPIISLRGRDRYIQDVFKKSDKKKKKKTDRKWRRIKMKTEEGEGGK